jgi:hypothetical protein
VEDPRSLWQSEMESAFEAVLRRQRMKRFAWWAGFLLGSSVILWAVWR